MKSNHISRNERLKNRIKQLYSKLTNDGWGEFGRGNPYRKCLGCGKAEPQISIDGHGKGCYIQGIRKEIEYYESIS